MRRSPAAHNAEHGPFGSSEDGVVLEGRSGQRARQNQKMVRTDFGETTQFLFLRSSIFAPNLAKLAVPTPAKLVPAAQHEAAERARVARSAAVPAGKSALALRLCFEAWGAGFGRMIERAANLGFYMDRM